MARHKGCVLSVHECKHLVVLLEARVDTLIQIGTDSALKNSRQLLHTRSKIRQYQEATERTQYEQPNEHNRTH